MKSTIDKLKFNHWLNIRKMSLAVLNKLLEGKVNYKISFDTLDEIDNYSQNLICDVLKIKPEDIESDEITPVFIYSSKANIEKTKRPITRDNIHFYNYYTLPTPRGYVAPVLIDILCPKNQYPKLNNGHLEPAITVSLGPQDIYARFDKKLNKTTWHKFTVNKDPKTDWIVGSSYFEPSYCLHTYSRATNEPGKILSYTTKSHLENVFSKLNDNSFDSLAKNIKNNEKNIEKVFLNQDIKNKGFSHEYLSKKAKVSITKLKKLNLNEKELKKICKIIGSDYSLYLKKKYDEDKIGRNYSNVDQTIKTIRKFKSYMVASIAYNSRFPDLFGYFLKVKNKKNKIIDLEDSNCSHYLCTKGIINFSVMEGKKIKNKILKEGDAIWVAAFSNHGFTGDGSLIKISDGQNLSYLEKIDLMNTYKLKDTLLRGRHDNINWGYDSNK
jgi:hypothetical protein